MTIPEIKQLCKSIIELAEKATPGPWEWDSARAPDEDGSVYVPQGSHLGDTLIALDDTYENSREDCAFIAASRNVTPQMAKALLEVIELIEFTASDNPGTAQLLLKSITEHFTN